MLARGARRLFSLPLHRSLQTDASHGSQKLTSLKKLDLDASVILENRLKSLVGQDNVSVAEAVRSQHGQDEGPEIGHAPDLVVYPSSTELVQEVCFRRICPYMLFHFITS